MELNEARECLAILAAAFHNEALEEYTAEFWLSELMEFNFTFSRETALTIARGSEKFPSLKEFRDTYRAKIRNDRSYTTVPALESGEERKPLSRQVPEWVWVWKWARVEGEDRPFPQQVGYVDPLTMMSMDTYEVIRECWVNAGSPKRTPLLSPHVKSLA